MYDDQPSRLRDPPRVGGHPAGRSVRAIWQSNEHPSRAGRRGRLPENRQRHGRSRQRRKRGNGGYQFREWTGSRARQCTLIEYQEQLRRRTRLDGVGPRAVALRGGRGGEPNQHSKGEQTTEAPRRQASLDRQCRLLVVKPRVCPAPRTEFNQRQVLSPETGGSSVAVELVKAFVADPEMVRDLVQYDAADLLAK